MSKMRDKEYDKEFANFREDLRRKAGEYLGDTPEQVIEKLVEKEVEKIVEVDNPKLVEELQELTDLLEFKDEELAKIKDALSDALNAEQAAKKSLADEKAKYKKDVSRLKVQVNKLKEAITTTIESEE